MFSPLSRPQLRPSRASAALLALLCAASVRSLSAQTWGSHGVTIHEIPGPFEVHGYGGVINNAGEVAGTSVRQAAVFKLGIGVTTLGSLGGPSFGYGINNSGEVTGGVFLNPSGGLPPHHAFLYGRSTMHDLGTLGGYLSAGSAINDAGQVTGGSSPSGDAMDHAFLWYGTMHDLGTLGGSYSHGYDINNDGVVTGVSTLSNEAFRRAFLYDGAMHDLGTLGGTFSYGLGINNAGQVMGGSSLGDGAAFHAFLYDGGMRDLGSLGGRFSYGYSISDEGVVVGVAADPNEIWKAALWESRGGSYQAYSLADIVNRGGDAAWSFGRAQGISADGRFVVASGRNARTGHNGWVVVEQHAISITPEPLSLLSLATGLAVVVGMRRRRSAGRV